MESSSDEDLPEVNLEQSSSNCEDQSDEDIDQVISKGNFVIVELCTKKMKRHYVAEILEVKENGLYDVKYFKKLESQKFCQDEDNEEKLVPRSKSVHDGYADMAMTNTCAVVI